MPKPTGLQTHFRRLQRHFPELFPLNMYQNFKWSYPGIASQKTQPSQVLSHHNQKMFRVMQRQSVETEILFTSHCFGTLKNSPIKVVYGVDIVYSVR